MDDLTAVLAGAALGGGFVWLALSRRGHEARALAAGLVVAAAMYLGFAAFGGAPVRWLAMEALGVGVFGGFAWLGDRRSAWCLVAGWALHLLWDVPLHSSGPAAAYTAEWYPALCFGFDPVAAVGAALLATRRQIPQA